MESWGILEGFMGHVTITVEIPAKLVYNLRITLGKITQVLRLMYNPHNKRINGTLWLLDTIKDQL